MFRLRQQADKRESAVNLSIGRNYINKMPFW